jgi:hypothetical protein
MKTIAELHGILDGLAHDAETDLSSAITELAEARELLSAAHRLLAEGDDSLPPWQESARQQWCERYAAMTTKGNP